MIQVARNNVHASRETIVHTFSELDAYWAYFSKSGDLAQVSAACFDALHQYELGDSWLKAIRSVSLKHGRNSAVETLNDLRNLEKAGLFESEAVVDEDRRQQAIEGFLKHKQRGLMLLVTDTCNLKCLYCYEVLNGVHENGRHLKKGDARVIVDQYFEATGKRRKVSITFFGGEPLLNFGCIQDVVAYAKERALDLGKELYFSMTTNLTVMTPEIADFLVEEKFSVMVSLDGDKERNDSMRITVGGKGTYDKVVENLKILTKKQKEGGVRTTRLRATVDAGHASAMEVERELLSIGTGLVRVGRIGLTGGGCGDSGNGSRIAGELREIHRDLLNGDSSATPSVLKSLEGIQEELESPAIHESAEQTLCGVCRNMKAVTPKGDIYPCHRYVGMDAYRLGNVHEGGVQDDLVREYYDKVTSQFYDKCTGCWARHLCGGACVWTLSKDDGTVSVPHDSECAEIRNSGEAQLAFYATLKGKPEVLNRIVSEAKEAEKPTI